MVGASSRLRWGCVRILGMTRLKSVLDELEMLDREADAIALVEVREAPQTEDLDTVLAQAIADAKRATVGLERAAAILQERAKHG